MAASEELAKQVLRAIEGLTTRMEALLNELSDEHRETWRQRFAAEAENLSRITAEDGPYGPGKEPPEDAPVIQA